MCTSENNYGIPYSFKLAHSALNLKNVYAGFSHVCYNSLVLICAVLSFPPGVWVGILNLTVQSLCLLFLLFSLVYKLNSRI